MWVNNVINHPKNGNGKHIPPVKMVIFLGDGKHLTVRWTPLLRSSLALKQAKDRVRMTSWTMTGWWFQTCFIFHVIYGMSSFPLTNSIIFQRGPNHQPDELGYVKILKGMVLPSGKRLHNNGKSTFSSWVNQLFLSHMLHVWNIYHHLPHKWPKCR